jgi:iron complex transport system ATP-binding protein
MDAPRLALDALEPGYVVDGRRTPVCPAVTERLDAGELVCLIGPNGAGKSTLMRTIAGLQPPVGGSVRLDGLDVHRMAPVARARHLAVVLTEAVQVPLLSAYDLVAYGRVPFTGWNGRLAPGDHRKIEQVLAAVGAGDLAVRQVSELSDGERQRVAVARALAQEPSVMILDEITGFLDLPRRIDTMRLLRDVAHDTGCAVLLSTHDLDLALRTADRIWLMTRGGPLRGALPETLVLDGAFQAAFALEGVAFDDKSGSFRIGHPRRQSVTLTGHGPAAMWTERALERYGFYRAATDAVGRVSVDIADGPEGLRWRLALGGAWSEHHTLDDLIQAVRTHSGAGPEPKPGSRPQ